MKIQSLFLFNGLLLRFSLKLSDTAHVRRTPWSMHALSASVKRAESNPVRPHARLLYGTREQTGHYLRFIWQRKGLAFGTLSHAHSNTPRWDTPMGGGNDCVKEEAMCTWSEMLCCRGLSGTQGTESREKSMVTRLVHTESTVSSVSVKKRRTLTECLRTNFSVCRGQPYRWGGGVNGTS